MVITIFQSTDLQRSQYNLLLPYGRGIMMIDEEASHVSFKLEGGIGPKNVCIESKTSGKPCNDVKAWTYFRI